jgi:hypothetical protein
MYPNTFYRVSVKVCKSVAIVTRPDRVVCFVDESKSLFAVWAVVALVAIVRLLL